MEIAFCKTLNMCRIAIVLLLHGAEMEEWYIRKELAGRLYLHSISVLEISRSRHDVISNSRLMLN